MSLSSAALKKLLCHSRLPGKTVFILGSGFSQRLGIPVMADFIPEGLALLKGSAWREGENASQQQDIVNDRELLEKIVNLLRRYENTIAQLDGGTANLEDLFCLVDLLAVRESPTDEDRRTLREFIGRVCALAWKRHEPEPGVKTLAPGAPTVPFRHYYPNKEATAPDRPGPRCDGIGNICLYEAFLSQVLFARRPTLAPKECPPEYAANAIVSLNYDLVIERIAARVGVRVFYGKGVLADKALEVEARPVIALNGEECAGGQCLPLIKLHGSLNWGGAEGQQPVSACGLSEKIGNATPLILPTWQRDPLGTGRSGNLLAAARLHLRLAPRWVFIGYSLPPTDRYLRYLFADALGTPELPEIEVCNYHWSKAEATQRCRSMLGSRATRNLTKVHNGLDEYVRALSNPSSL